MREVETKRAALERTLQSGLRDAAATDQPDGEEGGEGAELGAAKGLGDDGDEIDLNSSARRTKDLQIQVGRCVFFIVYVVIVALTF